MPNLFAHAMLLGWPIISWILFRVMKSPERALIATVIWGYLLLPTQIGYNFPFIPTIDRIMVPSLAATILYPIALRRQARKERNRQRRAEAQNALPRRGAPAAAEAAVPPEPQSAERRKTRGPSLSRVTLLIWLLAGFLICSPLLTWLGNRAPTSNGAMILPGMRVTDIFSIALRTLVMLLPFWLARKALVTREARLDFLRIFVWGALVYSVMALIEIRMHSPFFNLNIYGFFQGTWFMQIRDGGFRPIIFLKHGLRVGIFLCMGVLAAATLARASSGRTRVRWLGATLWLFAVLAVSHNLGALLITLVLLPVVLLAPLRLQAFAAAVIAGVLLVYPLARGGGLIPAERILAGIESISADRARSFQVRLNNEDILLARANLQPLTGWGGWGRNRVFDPETGKDISITDGMWIILMGMYGWTGYLAYFGLFCLPALLYWRMRNRIGPMDPVDLGLLLMLCANIVDLIPNSSMLPILWMLSGAAWARLETGSRQAVPAKAQRRRGTAQPHDATTSDAPA